MAVSIQQLSPGDEIQIWMRNGLAIQPKVTGKGSAYYAVPNRPGKARAGDLTRFLGWVIRNNVDARVITVQVSAYNSWRQPIHDRIPKSVDLSYTALQRVRLFSKISLAPREQIVGAVGTKSIRRPGSISGTGGTDLRPYRTVEEVLLS